MRRSIRGTVIVVEDDSSVSHALERILRLGGMAPTSYASGEALLEEPRPLDADCLILDIQLPGIGGFDLRDRLAQRGSLPPVIFITAFDEVEVRARAKAAGAAAFLLKPFSGHHLLETIEQVVTPVPLSGNGG